jgi:biopolymer transport protein ExbD
MRQRRFSIDEEPIAEPLVNLTPLIDVVFVVLIAFMLIAPLLEVDTVDLAVGAVEKKKEALAPEATPLSIIVRADNTIWMKGRRFSMEELEQTLLAEKKIHPGKIPQVIHDRNASFGTYQSVKNIMEKCGFEQMDVVLKPG